MTRLSRYLVILALLLPAKAICQNPQHLSPTSGETGPITIGLLLPDLTHSKVIKAAELAIEHANMAGGYMNREFMMMVRTAEGFWGAGSKESVSLVYEDHVCAIVGSLDGRNGHLAEQVATKSHLSYIETFATEPTLSQAFVPWFMRVVPNDNQQSAMILNQIKKEGGGTICILSSGDYDTRYAVRSLTKAVATETNSSPLVIELDTMHIKPGELINHILSSNPDHLVIPLDAPHLGDLILSLGEVLPDLKIYGNLHFAMGIEKRGSNWKDYEGVYMIRPGFNSDKYPELTDCHSAYMYDAINLVINAVHRVGTDRKAITDHISDSNYTKGWTGDISFDELGNRQGASSLIRIQSGRPELINQP